MEPNGIHMLKCISESNEISSLLVFKALVFSYFCLISINSCLEHCASRHIQRVDRMHSKKQKSAFC